MSLFAILWIICGPVNFYLFLKLAKNDGWFTKDRHLNGDDLLGACLFLILGPSGLIALTIVHFMENISKKDFNFWKFMNKAAQYLDRKLFS